MRIPVGTLALLLAALPSAAQQSQQNPPPSPDQSQSQSQSPTQDQSQSQSSSSDKSKPAAPERKRLPLGKQPTTADENPFPEDVSKKAAAAAGNPAPDAPKADKPPSSGDPKSAAPAPDYSSSRTGLHDIDDDSRESRISDGAGGYIHDPKLAAQDVKVGGFYLTNGDYKGAYDRFKEATKVNPENPDAVFGLAEAARGLKLNSEAVDNYAIYLDAFPDGPKAKAARKALAGLGAPQKK